MHLLERGWAAQHTTAPVHVRGWERKPVYSQRLSDIEPPDAFLSQIVLTQDSVEHRRLTFWKWKIDEGLLIKYAHFRWNFTLCEKILDCCKLSGVLLTMRYQVMFAWQWQAMQATLSHVTSKMESVKWTVQILKTSFTFIRSGYLCIRHEVCQPHFSLTKFSAPLNFNELILYYVWKMTPRWFHENQVPMKYELLLEASPLT